MAAPVNAARLCTWCQESDQTRACKGCNLARYCSTDHQRADWPRHKSVCRLSHGAPSSGEARTEAAAAGAGVVPGRTPLHLLESFCARLGDEWSRQRNPDMYTKFKKAVFRHQDTIERIGPELYSGITGLPAIRIANPFSEEKDPAPGDQRLREMSSQEQVRYLRIGNGNRTSCQNLLQAGSMRLTVIEDWREVENYLGNLRESPNFHLIHGQISSESLNSWPAERAVNLITCGEMLFLLDPRLFVPILNKMWNMLAPGGLCSIDILFEESEIPEAKEIGWWRCPVSPPLVRNALRQIGFEILGESPPRSGAISFSLQKPKP